MEIFRATSALVILVFIPVIRSVRRWEANLRWCTGDSKLFEGDFNGDRRTDLLCHRLRDGYKSIAFANVYGEFTGTNWEQGIGWCYHDGDELHIGDFNGDGRSDMLCHDTGNGDKSVALANGNGDFSGRTTWEASLGFCYHGGSEIHIGDFNGDGRDDMLCHDGNGYKWIANARQDGSFDGPNWEGDLYWCFHPGSQVFIGDFSGDSKSDLLCHDRNGYKWIAYANSEGNFDGGTDWELGIEWCRDWTEKLYIGDFNGDGKDDMLCHGSYTGSIQIALANRLNNFSDGTSLEWDLGWCNYYADELHVGDFNGGRKTDMLCHDTRSGKKSIIYSESLFQ